MSNCASFLSTKLRNDVLLRAFFSELLSSSLAGYFIAAVYAYSVARYEMRDINQNFFVSCTSLRLPSHCTVILVRISLYALIGTYKSTEGLYQGAGFLLGSLADDVVAQICQGGFKEAVIERVC